MTLDEVIGSDSFQTAKQTNGVLAAIARHFPYLAAHEKRRHEELLRLIATRQRFIAYIVADRGVSQAEAERIAEGKAP